MRLTLLLTAAYLYSVPALSAQFGSWDVDVTPDGSEEILYAGTTNDSGAILGQFCVPSTDSCVWLIAMTTSCDEGHTYPVLANSDAGAAQLLVLCNAKLENGLYRYVFTDFDAVDNIVRKGSRVGFAAPLQSDQFKVVRFRLNGSIEALTLLNATSERATKKQKAVPSKDSTYDVDL